MGRPDATREEILAALHNAQCDDILEKLPQGMDTVIGTKGIYLSGGEQQRVNIARGLIRPMPLLLLDEPTASLDGINRQVVIDLIHEARQRGSAIVGIFHDDVARNAVADRIVPMDRP